MVSKLYLLFFTFISINIFPQVHIKYPNINGLGKQTFSYAVLNMALENSGEDYEIELLDYEVNDTSVRQMLKKGKIDIADFGTSKKFEDEFLPIYIPIDYGLNGWRIFIIHKDNKSKFSRINTIADLKNYTAGQGSDWADITILENSGLKVVTAPQITSMLGMVNKKRVDYFPLEANYVHWLVENNKEAYPHLYVDQNLLLIYPFARFFFVNKKNTNLHRIVKKGLEISFENGSFLELFKTHKASKDIFTKARLNQRKLIYIENPLMSERFKQIPKKYFFSLSMLEN